MRIGILAVVILFAAGVTCGAIDAVYPIDLVLSTTSDWTDVSLVGGTLVIQSYEIIAGSDASGLQISGLSTMSVSQSIVGRTRVTIRFRAVLADPADWLRIRINKGHLGETSLAVHEHDSADPLATFTHVGVVDAGDPGNERTFSQRSSMITSVVSPMTLDVSDEAFGGPKVLAFYYPWYGIPDGPSGEWVHWNPNTWHHDSAHDPASGFYDSNDPETVRRHIQEAKSAGIDGFIASWWGPYGFEDRAFSTLIEVAEEEDFLVTIYYEEADTPLEMVTDLAYFLNRHADSPALLHADGRPVIFFYVRVTQKFTVAQWQAVFAQLDDRGRSIFAVADGLDSDFLTTFDGIHIYNPVGIGATEAAAQYASASLLARAQGRLFAATIIPGYDEAYKNSSLTYLDREDGDTYREYWALARASTPHWILITSYNEWHEGSEIEPSVEFGTTYLEITAEQAAAWKCGEAPPAVEPDRDGDGVPDDEDYCPDFPGSAMTNGC
jgi:hypothetical protein